MEACLGASERQFAHHNKMPLLMSAPGHERPIFDIRAMSAYPQKPA